MDHTQLSRIKHIQENINEQFAGNILHILNGQAMYEMFHNNQLMSHGHYAPFNEAMCTFQTTDRIFGDEFIKLRSSEHQVALHDYETVVITPLEPLFDDHYPCVVLWFGDDMFCQMNMLTVLAYLDQSGYKGEVYVHMVREANGDIEAAEAVEISPEGYHEVYQQVLIHHRFPDAPGLPVMRSAIERYIEYRKEDNEITAYMKRNIDQPSDELLRNLFREFPQYGLGDVQYYKIIEKVKRSWRTRNVK